MFDEGRIGCWVIIVVAILLAVLLIINVTPSGRRLINNWRFDVQKIDDATNYDTIKKVEDTCRAMMASFEGDKSTWEMYKDSEIAEEQSWAKQAKMRANKTAATYNEYILKNTFQWKGNVPRDIWLDMVPIP